LNVRLLRYLGSRKYRDLRGFHHKLVF
jgi:hypothetical protein